MNNPTRCDRCGKVAPITHRIKSDTAVMLVCYSCGEDAERLAGLGILGLITIQIILPQNHT